MIKGIIFDYGGTLDTGGRHWSKVIWDAYQKELIPISWDQFWEAYVHAERTLGRNPIIRPDDTFLDVLRAKTDIQTRFLADNHMWPVYEVERRAVFEHLALDCYHLVLAEMQRSRPMLRDLASRYPLVLVTNFYGNIHTVLREFRIDSFFVDVVESAVVGVRKPDPEIFRLGVEALSLSPEEVLVVGDSLEKDILPAQSLGCMTWQVPPFSFPSIL